MKQIYTIFLKIIRKIAIFAVFSILFYSCSSLDIERQDKSTKDQYVEAKYGKGVITEILEDSGTLSDTFGIFGSKGAKVKIPLLYTVALDKLSFMPLDSLDSDGGVITTDWYDIANVENERVKFVVYILNDQINNDSLDIKMFKQEFNGSIWKSSGTDDDLVKKIKSSILQEAQRLATAASQS